jgi:hypothetical protein
MLKDLAGDSLEDDFDPDHVISEITEAFRRLKNQLNKGNTIAGPTMRIYIAFDEAHPLTVPFSEHSAESNYSQLHQALNHLHKLPLFTFFFSMTGKISEFTPPCGFDASKCLNHGDLDTPTPTPFIQVLESWRPRHSHSHSLHSSGL